MRQNVQEYFSLRKANEQLARENAILKSAAKNSFIKIDQGLVNINDTIYHQQYQYLEAKVINSTTNKRLNSMTINRGAVHGVESGMGVICGKGVVGIVNEVSTHFSSIMPLININTIISSKISESNYFGITQWNGENFRKAQVNDIPSHTMINPGDKVVTRSASAIFPEGIPIGTISSVDLREGQSYFDVEMDLSVDFSRVYHVYVIYNLLKKEQLQLEKDSQDE
jgi:rod shape-determining protein MreC